MVPIDADRLATEVFGNRQRTSTHNGILKADAVVRFAGALARHRIEHLQDVLEASDLSAVERDVRRIPGQSSGLSWRYFLMLVGREDLVKPDRMILRFLERVVGRPVGPDDAQAMLTTAARELDREFPGIKPRTLDNLIWRQERERYFRQSAQQATNGADITPDALDTRGERGAAPAPDVPVARLHSAAP